MLQPNPPGLFDEIISESSYSYCSKTDTPIRDSVIETVVSDFGGETSQVTLESPDGNPHVVSGEGTIPEETDELIDELNQATEELGERPVGLIKNLFGVHYGSLHFTDSSASFVLGDEVYDGDAQFGTSELPDSFNQLGIKVAHTMEGFEIGRNKDYHWLKDLPWNKTHAESMITAIGRNPDDPILGPDNEERQNDMANKAVSIESTDVPISNGWIINLPTIFPAQSFGQATNAPATAVVRMIAQTERIFADTLFTERQAQYTAIQANHLLLTDPNKDHNEAKDIPFKEIIMETFGYGESGYRSLKSQVEQRRRAAFQTVREGAEAEEFNYVMAEFAETIEELGKLAYLGAQYRAEQGKPMGFH